MSGRSHRYRGAAARPTEKKGGGLGEKDSDDGPSRTRMCQEGKKCPRSGFPFGKGRQRNRADRTVKDEAVSLAQIHKRIQFVNSRARSAQAAWPRPSRMRRNGKM